MRKRARRLLERRMETEGDLYNGRVKEIEREALKCQIYPNHIEQTAAFIFGGEAELLAAGGFGMPFLYITCVCVCVFARFCVRAIRLNCTDSQIGHHRLCYLVVQIYKRTSDII